jgi:hypothetical protein
MNFRNLKSKFIRGMKRKIPQDDIGRRKKLEKYIKLLIKHSEE